MRGNSSLLLSSSTPSLIAVDRIMNEDFRLPVAPPCRKAKPQPRNASHDTENKEIPRRPDNTGLRRKKSRPLLQMIFPHNVKLVQITRLRCFHTALLPIKYRG